MQRNLRLNEVQLYNLSEKAITDNGIRGYLYKRTSDNSKWQLKWFVLFQNLLFYFENESSAKPSGVIFLEGSYCDKIVPAKNSQKSQHIITITYRKEGSKQYELKSDNESECNAWVHCIECASFSKMMLQKEELEQKYIHLVQIVESEKTAKWQYTQQCEEYLEEIKKLREELITYKKDRKISGHAEVDESEDIRKIKKVQGFFRGWRCRRRWKQIVAEYINSPHAENMRKRNSLVFRMVEAEEEYVEQLQFIVSFFLRPFKMAASSQKPPCSYDEINSIFLNSETIMFLHQIFLKGLTARMENWPTLVLGDLFDMLLPMLVIYQEYVRNHHFSLQVLAECKQKAKFAQLLKRLEEKPLLQSRSLETYLTYPMHQVPRYIITLHELLAHTPYNHVERKSLENAKSKLEELSRQMHDEVSETESIRKNLAIEKIIVGGCDILLDVNQVFVMQGNVLQIYGSDRGKSRSRLGAFRGEKEVVRQCFLFTNHMLICTRVSNGKLQLAESIGKIPLVEATLIEDPSEQAQYAADGSTSSGASDSVTSSTSSGVNSGKDYGGLDFKIIWDHKTGPSITIHLVAPTMQEKAVWISDISQCIDNVHFNDLFHSTMNDSSSVTMPHSIKSDPRLYKDDVDIRFSRTLNSCKLPQIRYASPERLFERLTDLRFLSIDFLNTFLLTYRVFTDGVTVLEALKKVHYNPELQMANMLATLQGSTGSLDELSSRNDSQANNELLNFDYDYSRRISAISVYSDTSEVRRESVVSVSSDTQILHNLHQAQLQMSAKNNQHWRLSHRKFEEEQARERYMKRFGERLGKQRSDLNRESAGTIYLSPEQDQEQEQEKEQEHEQEQEGETETEAEAEVETEAEAEVEAEAEAEAETEVEVEVKIKAETETEPTAERVIEPIIVSSASCLDMPLQTTSEACSLEGEKTEIPYETPIIRCATNEKETDSLTADFAKLNIPIHSLSQDTLKAEHSYPDSPTVLSTAVSSLTLVGSIDSKNGSPKSSPVSKTSPQELPTPKTTTSDEAVQTDLYSSSYMFGSSFTLFNSNLFNPRFMSKGYFGPQFASHSANQFSLTPKSGNYLRVRNTSIKTMPGESDSSTFSSSTTPRSSFQGESTISSPRSSFQLTESPQKISKAGVVVTSSRASSRRSSTASAASAFAAATAASNNPPEPLPPTHQGFQSRGSSRFSSAMGTDLKIPAQNKVKRESVISTAATMRVLNVLRHWISKHSQDFINDPKLMHMTTEFLDDLVHTPALLPAEHKAASQLLQMITKEDQNKRVDLDVLLSPPIVPSPESAETLQALEIAEGMTYLDGKIFGSIQSAEFLGQAWMKNEKTTKAPHILLMTKRFNEVSRLVVSEIMRASDITQRLAIIDKWAAVADICRVMHNFNGVLQICAAFTNSSVFRLKKTWDRVQKSQTKTVYDRLQSLVSTDGKFRNMREALHRCDPPCIPYLGMYLSDLTFIEEGTPNFTDDGLLNFSKMRMIAHVIREIRHFQQTPYNIEMNPKVINYLLDTSHHLDDEQLYQLSLCLEPRTSRLGSKISASSKSSTPTGPSSSGAGASVSQQPPLV